MSRSCMFCMECCQQTTHDLPFIRPGRRVQQIEKIVTTQPAVSVCVIEVRRWKLVMRFVVEFTTTTFQRRISRHNYNIPCGRTLHSGALGYLNVTWLVWWNFNHHLQMLQSAVDSKVGLFWIVEHECGETVKLAMRRVAEIQLQAGNVTCQ